jgi:hypothetical protein
MRNGFFFSGRHPLETIQRIYNQQCYVYYFLSLLQIITYFYELIQLPLKNFIRLSLFLIANLSAFFAMGQVCPPNIGFESSNFSNWKTYTGTVAFASGINTISLFDSPVTPDRHVLMTSPSLLDPYGRFPVLAPNGSKRSVKLGNSGGGRLAEGMSYLINVPTDQATFVLTYQYAVVFQNPNHTIMEQPRFTAKVLDLSTNTYVQCASFEYAATAALPGFQVSSVSNVVLYKDWTPVTIDLTAYKGKQLRLEFATADCTQGGHFGYAYVDVNENCAGLIAGSAQCPDAEESNLSGPSGYLGYKWYSADRSVFYGEGQKIKIKPAIEPGKAVQLDLIPFDGFGCPNTVYTNITETNFELDLMPVVNLCSGDVLDLISPTYILNKIPDATYTVFRDEELTDLVNDPTTITTSGKYYIKGMLASGCISVKPIDVDFFEIPVDVATNVNVCIGSIVNLTSSDIQRSIPPDVTVSYFLDIALQKPIPNPAAIISSGTYFIKYETTRCTLVKQINVAINPMPTLKVTSPNPICIGQYADLTDASITLGSDPGLNFTYFTDAALSIPVPDPKFVNAAGDYYIKGSNASSCDVSDKVTLVVNPVPVLVVQNPGAVCAPNTVDVTDPSLYLGSSTGGTFSFTDNKGNVVPNPKAIDKSGIFLVTITNNLNCSVTKTMQVVVNPQPVVVITQPKKVFIDQSVNLTSSQIIEGSSGYKKITYWQDDQMTISVANPKSVTKAGTYYIAFTSALGCLSVAPVDVENVPRPKIKVPTAFTPLKNDNNILYPFFEGIQKLNSFKIYNTWGNLVFETNSMSPADGWNGTFHNALQPFETYTWFAEGVDMLDGIFTTKGKTVLIP